MIRRRLLLALPLLPLLAGAPARAAEEGAKKDGAKKEVGQFLDLQPVGMPVVVDGALVNYIFVDVRLNLAPSADPIRWRAKEPFFRDALVRAGHAAPFTLPGDYDHIDAAKLSAVMMREVAAIAGPGVVRSVVVTKQAPMHLARSPHA
jgi:hypothetical protein